MKKIILIYALVFVFSKSHAKGHDSGNGGDPCENKIQEISLDIKSWITRGGHKGLILTDIVSVQSYANKMLDRIKYTSVSCSSERLYVGGLEKTCKNYVNESGRPEIKCNFDRFSDSNIEEQYRLIHHEYAGMANIEISRKGKSDYRISNQVSGFLENQFVKKLAVKGGSNTGHVRKNYCNDKAMIFGLNNHLLGAISHRLDEKGVNSSYYTSESEIEKYLSKKYYNHFVAKEKVRYFEVYVVGDSGTKRISFHFDWSSPSSWFSQTFILDDSSRFVLLTDFVPVTVKDPFEVVESASSMVPIIESECAK